MLESVFNKIATLLKTTLTQVFYCEYCEIFKNTYFEEHLPSAASVTSLFTWNICAFLPAKYYRCKFLSVWCTQRAIYSPAQRFFTIWYTALYSNLIFRLAILVSIFHLQLYLIFSLFIDIWLAYIIHISGKSFLRKFFIAGF